MGQRDLVYLSTAVVRATSARGSVYRPRSRIGWTDCIPFEPESFDLVAALDVIEHLEDDRACTESLQRYVKPGGWGLFTVPAYRFLWSQHDEVHHHKRRYTRQAFTEMLTSSGFTPVYASYFNTLLFPAISGVRLGKNALKIDSANDDAIPSPFVNAVLRTLFASERHLMPRVALPFGVSILTTARRADE